MFFFVGDTARKPFRTLSTLTALIGSLALQAGAQIDGETVSLSGTWSFAFDPKECGIAEKWYSRNHDRATWRVVRVPHTWQIEPGNEEYMGTAWYARSVAPDRAWRGKDIRLAFGAVYRDAQVWLNGELIGEHKGSGWTPFTLPITEEWDAKETNWIVVRVDNRFSNRALPYENSFDWATDGGITRDVQLIVNPPVHIERLLVTATPSQDFSSASVRTSIQIQSAKKRPRGLKIETQVFEPGGTLVLSQTDSATTLPEENGSLALTISIQNPRLWHFDFPNLYRIRCTLWKRGKIVHRKEAQFGIRSVVVRDGRYILNGEPMRLMGVEWMPGSDPRYGMAENSRVTREILTDMKRLNCLLTRFHWQQDDSVFTFCDREGMLVQEEIPTWGSHRLDEPIKAIQAAQLRETIVAHFNHPSIYCWGICNEIAGQSESGHQFIENGKRIAETLDPGRLLTYASNTLHNAPSRDAGRLLDFLEWNDYYESWYGGTLEDMEESLQRIHDELPEQSVVISEYGLCECNPKLPEGDAFRIGVMRSHTDLYRKADWVAGAIFFDYNDYRTHIGDKGQGAFKQRVHGVVDLLGRRKPSWEALRREASPIKRLTVTEPVASMKRATSEVRIVTRALENDLPSYTLRGYTLTWTAYNEDKQPIGTGKRVLDDLPPGTDRVERIEWPGFDALSRVQVEVFRPTGYSVLDAQWPERANY